MGSSFRQTVTKPVAPGNYYTLAVGLDTVFGLGFKALAAGDVVITAAGPPGVIATDGASLPIIIHP